MTAIAAGLDEQRRRICETALAELGTGEEPVGSNRGPCERYMPGWVLHRLESGERGPPWCAFFACWVWRQALDHHPLAAHIGSVAEMRRRALDRDMWMGLEGYRRADRIDGPQPGDALVMLDDRGLHGHVEIVIRAADDGREWLACGGNTGHAVRVGRRSVTDAEVRGVINPLHDWRCGGTWERGLGGDDGDDVREMGTR